MVSPRQAGGEAGWLEEGGGGRCNVSSLAWRFHDIG